MVKGIGIDLVDINKIRKMSESRRERFYSRIFSDIEAETIENIKSKNENRGFQKAAGYFAAKEAFLKAVGKGLFSIPLNKIIILNDESGQPYINIDINTNIDENFKKNISSAKVSITHDKGFACAVVVVQ